MEAPVATLGSSVITSVIGRLRTFASARPHEPASGNPRSGGGSLSALAAGQALTGEDIDRLWLQRPELRSVERVRKYLERTSFHARAGTTIALFVDGRCGLIADATVGPNSKLRADEAVRYILQLASSYHAHGIILATNDPRGTLAASASCREMTEKLHSKGEATEIYLLNHLVRTSEGWLNLVADNDEGQVTCAC